MKRPILKSKIFFFGFLFLSALYYFMPVLTRQLAKLFVFREYLHLDAPRLAVGFKKGMLWPISKWVNYTHLDFVAWLWFAFIVFGAVWVWRKSKKFRRPIAIFTVGILALLYIFPNTLLLLENDKPSKSIGHVANGKILNAKRVPMRGPNYTTYSFLAYLAGRTFVNDKVRDAILRSYEICNYTCPNTSFVLGEIGFKHGDTFLPHRTHKNGLSVDFMSPMKKGNKPYRSNHLFNLWGYQLEFDNDGKKGNKTIDFESTAQHLLALDKAAKEQGMVIQKVIFDPVFRDKLKSTSCWSQIRHLPFTKNRVAWRHDDHYHVDFGFPSNGIG